LTPRFAQIRLLQKDSKYGAIFGMLHNFNHQNSQADLKLVSTYGGIFQSLARCHLLPPKSRWHALILKL